MGINYGSDEIFDGRKEWATEPFGKIQVAHESDRPFGEITDHNRPLKIYKLMRGELKVLTADNHQNSQAIRCIDSIFDYMKTQDVYQNAFKIISFK